MKTLINELKKADAINIDDQFIRYFDLNDYDLDEYGFLTADNSCEGSTFDYSFTRKEIESAVYTSQGDWKITKNSEVFIISLFSLYKI